MYQLGEMEWLDKVLQVGQTVADMNAARRQQANAAAAARAAGATPIVIPGEGVQPQSNTLMYVGIGAGILAIAGIAYKVANK
ncbi:MAG TPA: hypothetical protein DHV25_04625 [Candidatus Kerfeldbacteria bacterium]|nr:hypothetical protein [Candidatus Kerfeldbacteria bacterium]